MKQIITSIFAFVLLLLLLSSFKKTQVTKTNYKQLQYNYSAESIGYSDFKRLYSNDTVNNNNNNNNNAGFFNSNTLVKTGVKIKCNIKESLLEKNSDGSLFCYTLKKTSFVINNNSNFLNEELLLKELKYPVFVQKSVLGKVVGIQLDTTMSDISAGILKNIISSMQFTMPKKKNTIWETSEENTIGSYNVKYSELKKDNLERSFSKEILYYTHYKSNLKNQRITIENVSVITTDSALTIKNIKSSESQIIYFKKDTLSAVATKVNVQLNTRFFLLKKERDSLLKIRKLSRYRKKTTLSEPISKQKIITSSYRGTLLADNWETLTQKLDHLEGFSNQQKDKLLLKFRALFYLYPETCKKAVLRIKQSDLEANATKLIFKALSMTETFEAINTIATIIDANKKKDNIMAELLPVLATTAFPTSKAVAIIKYIAFNKEEDQDDFIRSTSQLTLGSMAHRYRSLDSIKSVNLTQYIMGEMELEKDSIQRLLVLGNTGSSIIFPTLKLFIESSTVSEEVKLEAISAMSLIDSKIVNSYLNKLHNQTNVNALRIKTKEIMDIRREIHN